MNMKNMTKHQQVFYLIGWASCIQSLAMGGYLAWRFWRDIKEAERKQQLIEAEEKKQWSSPTYYGPAEKADQP